MLSIDKLFQEQTINGKTTQTTLKLFSRKLDEINGVTGIVS